MKHTPANFWWTLTAMAVCAIPARAQHAGDMVVGTSGAGRLKLSGFSPQDAYVALPPVNQLLHGWANNSPGFDHAIFAVPDDDFYPMEKGAQIQVSVVEIDPAFRVIDASFQILGEPGESTALGDYLLHRHLTFHINVDDPAFDDEQCVWHATFELIDVGPTGYDASAPFTMSFANVPWAPALQPPIVADGDFDGNGLVDLTDYDAFGVCASPPQSRPKPTDPAITTCEVDCVNAFDFDTDLDVDLHDFAGFQARFGD